MAGAVGLSPLPEVLVSGLSPPPPSQPSITTTTSATTAIIPYQCTSRRSRPAAPEGLALPSPLDSPPLSAAAAPIHSILATDPHFARFVRPLHEDFSTALSPYVPPSSSTSSDSRAMVLSSLKKHSPTEDDHTVINTNHLVIQRGGMVEKEVGAFSQAQPDSDGVGVVKRPGGGLDELIAFAEALCTRAERGNLMVEGTCSESEHDLPPREKTVGMEVRMEVKTHGLGGGGGHNGKAKHSRGQVAVGAKVRAYSPQLLREYALADEKGETLRRAPLILLELTDIYLEEAITRYFRLYEELYQVHVPAYEKPTLFIFADITSTALSPRQQLDLLRKIAARLKHLEQEGKAAYKEAASRVFFNDPNAHIQGLSLASSNDLIVNTIRRSSVCGLNFLRCLTGRDVLRLCRYKVGDASDAEEEVQSDGKLVCHPASLENACKGRVEDEGEGAGKYSKAANQAQGGGQWPTGGGELEVDPPLARRQRQRQEPEAR